MNTADREALATLLFENQNVEIVDVKFLRGAAATSEGMCGAAAEVLAPLLLNHTQIVDQPPVGRRPQKSVDEIFAAI